MTTLPRFRRPPVLEVAFGAQFEHLSAFLSPHVGLLWQELRSRFPKLQQKNPIIPTIERQGLIRNTQQIQFAVSPTPIDFRVWLLSEDDHNILQLQPNFFVRNWRRLDGMAGDYPSYDNLLPEFHSDYVAFARFIEKQGLGEVRINQCELTYVNQIQGGEGWAGHDEISKVISLFPSDSVKSSIKSFDSINASFSRQITDEQNGFIGRLHVSIATEFTTKQPKNPEDRAIHLTLVARGRPASSTLNEVKHFFDIAHHEIVTTFQSITTSRMHRIWELIDE